MSRAPRRVLPSTIVALALVAVACGDAADTQGDPAETPVDSPTEEPDEEPGEEPGDQPGDGTDDGPAAEPDGAEPDGDPGADAAADGVAPACEDLGPQIAVDGGPSDDEEIARIQQQRADVGLPSSEDDVREVMEDTDPSDWSFSFPHTLEELEELEGRGGVADEHVGAIRAWAASEVEDEYAGLWVDQSIGGALVVAFTDDVEGYRDEVHERFSPHIVVVEVENSHRELEAVLDDLGEQLSDPDAAPRDPSAPGTVVHYGLAEDLNRVAIAIVGGDDEALRAFSDAHGDDRICFLVHEDPNADREPDDRVTTLARADGWRAELEGNWDIYRLLEVADDEQSARRAWDDNVPSDLADAGGDPDAPAEPGLYGSFDDLDLDTHALVVWSAGESGSCPEWIHGIETTDDGIEVTYDSTAGPGQACTDDFSAYRLVLAVDREVLPDLADLPMPLAGDGYVELDEEAVPYPAS